MQNKKCFLLIIVTLFFNNTQPFVSGLIEKAKDKKFFIGGVIGFGLIGLIALYFYKENKRKQSLAKKDPLEIEKKNLQRDMHNLLQYIEKTDEFINRCSEKKRDEDFNRKLVDWKSSLGDQSRIQDNYDRLEKNMSRKELDALNGWFARNSENIEKNGDEILGRIFGKPTNFELTLNIANISKVSYIMVRRYYFNNDRESSYFKGSELFDTLKEKNIENINIFTRKDIQGEDIEISKYGFYPYTSQPLTPQLKSQ